jgi:hypothetical protein
MHATSTPKCSARQSNPKHRSHSCSHQISPWFAVAAFEAPVGRKFGCSRYELVGPVDDWLRLVVTPSTSQPGCVHCTGCGACTSSRTGCSAHKPILVAACVCLYAQQRSHLILNASQSKPISKEQSFKLIPNSHPFAIRTQPKPKDKQSALSDVVPGSSRDGRACVVCRSTVIRVCSCE